MFSKTILFTAAHSGFNLGQVPLGGGAAICNRLSQEWSRSTPFRFEVLGPSLLKKSSPVHKDLVHYSELEYARFCREFERALTRRILQYDPKDVVVLCNDVSEGPDFKLLAQKGYSLFTIYHVDVVHYFSSLYLRSVFKPETTTRVHRFLQKSGLSRLMPDVLRLVWDKQEASVLGSQGLIVPSQGMKDVLLKCYPTLPEQRVHVMPWGIWEEPAAGLEITAAREYYQKTFPSSPGAFKLLLLSRISPEKGQHRLLEALSLWESEPDYPEHGVCVYLAGEAAYMMGKKYENRLKILARKLKRTTVHFHGHTAGARKRALYDLADLYVFPSIHESYGLTLMEALRCGMPVLTTASLGAREVFRSGMGEMIPNSPKRAVPQELLRGLKRLWAGRDQLKDMGKAGQAAVGNYNFSETASGLAALLASQ